MAPKFAALILSLLPISLAGQSTGHIAAGYITSVNPDGTFSVEGWPVHLESNPVFFVHLNPGGEVPATSFEPFVGEFVEVGGSRTKGKSTQGLILGSSVTRIMPDLDAVHGTAIIDFVPPPDATGPDSIVRADGRFLRIPATAKVKFEDGLIAGSILSTNTWITYAGQKLNDGTVLVETATLCKNSVKGYESKLQTKTDYDPAAVKPNQQQGRASKWMLGFGPRKVHPHSVDVLQARITRIGESLVPEYQRSLAAEDPTRLSFRFYLVDLPELQLPIALTNGIVLVPFARLNRLHSDSELAAPLAIAIAFALEKVQIRDRTAKNTLAAAEVAGLLSLLSPVAIAGLVVVNKSRESINDLQIEQAGRVALCLLHDAGYDIDMAPMALWLADPDEAQPIQKTRMPKRAADLYESLGTVWQPRGVADQLSPKNRRE